MCPTIPNLSVQSPAHSTDKSNRSISPPITIDQITDTIVLLHVFISLKDRLYNGPKIATHH